MVYENATPANDIALPDIAEIHTQMIFLHGLTSVLTSFDKYDTRTRNGGAALEYVIEQMAEKISRDMGRLVP